MERLQKRGEESSGVMMETLKGSETWGRKKLQKRSMGPYRLCCYLMSMSFSVILHHL